MLSIEEMSDLGECVVTLADAIRSVLSQLF